MRKTVNNNSLSFRRFIQLSAILNHSQQVFNIFKSRSVKSINMQRVVYHLFGANLQQNIYIQQQDNCCQPVGTAIKCIRKFSRHLHIIYIASCAKRSHVLNVIHNY